MFQTVSLASGVSKVMRWRLQTLMERILAVQKKVKERRTKDRGNHQCCDGLKSRQCEGTRVPSNSQYYCSIFSTIKTTQRYCYGHRLHDTIHVHSNGLNVPNSMHVDWLYWNIYRFWKAGVCVCVDLQVDPVPTSGDQTAAQQAAMAALHSWQYREFSFSPLRWKGCGFLFSSFLPPPPIFSAS